MWEFDNFFFLPQLIIFFLIVDKKIINPHSYLDRLARILASCVCGLGIL